MKPMISVASRALPHLYRIANKGEHKAVKFSLQSGGCNGFAYRLEPVLKDTQPNYDIQQIDSDLDVHICKKSSMYLLGCEIDWAEDNMGARFVFNNPLAANQCGCKSSFTPTML